MMYSKSFGILLILSLIVSGCGSNESPGENKKQTLHPSLTSNSIEVSQSWARPASAGTNSAAYLHIFNGTDRPDTLLSVKADAAENAAVHESYREDGISSMLPARRLIIQPDSSLSLAPGVYHIMLMNLKKSMAESDSLNLQLSFSETGNRTITIPVKLTY